jgi:hypothetical protein
MTSKWMFAALLFAGLAGGCGNYSNDDVDFQLALPNQSDIEANGQGVSLTRGDSAEYYNETRAAVINFNTLVANLTAFVDNVRGYTPTSRHGNERTWGPFPDDQHAGWETRVVMRRSEATATLLHMDYWVQVRQVGQGESGWFSLLTGAYTSQGSARTGYGDIHFNVGTARKAGYPTDTDPGVVELDHLDVCYDRSSNASVCNNVNAAAVYVDMTIVNVATAKTQSGRYVYELAQDNSGNMQFNWQGTTDAGVPITATVHARWWPTGAGRADLVVDFTPNLPRNTTLGTDCWGQDTVATYVSRLGQTPIGDPATCVF